MILFESMAYILFFQMDWIDRNKYSSYRVKLTLLKTAP